MIGCWRFTIRPAQNGACNSHISSEPESLLGEFSKASESRISETEGGTNDICIAAKELTLVIPMMAMFSE